MTERPDGLPVVSFPRLWHVGSLDPADKRPGSFEGAGLSVSRHPGAWRAIARGAVSGPCWVARTSDRVLLDAHGMTPEQRTEVLAWGRREGLCEPRQLWRVTLHDDELDVDRTFHVETREEAIEESGLDEDEIDEDVVVHDDGHASTPKLDLLSLSDRPVLGDGQVVDQLLPLWVSTIDGIDGVWWEDDLDVLAYSAPRGCIPSAAVAEWGFESTGFEPEEESDLDDEADERA